PAVTDALEKAGIKTLSAEISMVPTVAVPVTDKNLAAAVMRFVNDLEDNDDVQNVYSNMDVDDKIMAEIDQ
ncbi:MAG: YebC/PmpR family DNA-binding transcriptional regulator, partial [Kiritimatiellae bacterium]|nr:YebC/PmpR family DNA-binding transcriptional regulator [Kiritimatiellia bacterium]